MDPAVRQLVWQRAEERCEYCRLPQSAALFLTFHVEHIRATQHSGGDDAANLALACPDCNAYKGPNLTAVDPKTDEVVPLFNPRLHKWNEHFRRSAARIVGRTPTGRATVHVLK